MLPYKLPSVKVRKYNPYDHDNLSNKNTNGIAYKSYNHYDNNNKLPLLNQVNLDIISIK